MPGDLTSAVVTSVRDYGLLATVRVHHRAQSFNFTLLELSGV